MIGVLNIAMMVKLDLTKDLCPFLVPCSSLICSLSVTLHDVVDLLQLVGQPLLAAELVLLQGDDQLLVVLHCVTEISED